MGFDGLKTGESIFLWMAGKYILDSENFKAKIMPNRLFSRHESSQG
jgi:hypothetical protein